MTATAPVKKVPIHLQSSQNRLLIKGGKVVNDDGMEDTDVYIEDGIIKQVGRNLIIPGGTRVIDATGKLVIPGGIDPHTHFELEMMGAKSIDDFYHGTKAAVAGGTTTVIDFVMPVKGQSLIEAFEDWRKKADSKVCCDYALHVAVPHWSEAVKKEMASLCSEEYGVNSFKMFMAYRGTWMLDDYDLYGAFEQCNKLGALPMVHAENGHIVARNTERLLSEGVKAPHGHELSRDEEVEGEAVNRACVVANQVKTPLYVVHMMSKSAVRSMRDARRRGQKCPLFGETLAASIGTDGTHCRNSCFRHAAAHVMSPPLRPDPTTPHALIEALSEDDLQTTASDNCTFSEKAKELGKTDFSKIPNGVNGVEDRMSLVWQKGVNTGIMTANRFVAVTSTNAAKIFNLYPQKGRIDVNSDADVVVWDPRLTKTISAKTHHHAVDFNIFEGQQVIGGPQYVIVNGRVCFDDGKLRVVEGFGRYLKTLPHSPHVFREITATEQKAIQKKENGDAPDAGGEKYTNGNTPRKGPDEQLMNQYLEDLEIQSNYSTATARKPRSEGVRDLQGSTFSISEEMEGVDRKTTIRVRNPPGGKSSGFW